ncbi:CaiB/BaiF CoA-transferase family protein [Aeromicrobium alkaliterrae]|uniref:CoA transferase n=1 Tax=Aeromicrobium alkaliterrae TaxID=302168 RepID=A0ABP4WKW6_9ACTN
MASDSALPLEGTIVADFTRVLAGPLASMTLADLGATVIKVEEPGGGDGTRGWGPPYSSTGATYFEAVNRSKQSIVLDLKSPEGRRLARELCHRADVVMENFRSGVMDRLGLGYDSVRASNPNVVYCSITAFGSGEGANLPGFDFAVQAMSGLMSITGHPDGEPTKVGVAIVDVLAGKDATIGILAALRKRDLSGEGTRLEVSLLASILQGMANQTQAVIGAGVTPHRLGNVHPSVVPYQPFKCADDYIAVASGTEKQFIALCVELGLPDLPGDPRFADNQARVAHQKELEVVLSAVMRDHSAADLVDRLMARGVPASKIANIAEALERADELGLDVVTNVPSSRGPIAQVRHPVRYSSQVVAPMSAPPELDAQGAEVRAWLNQVWPEREAREA